VDVFSKEVHIRYQTRAIGFTWKDLLTFLLVYVRLLSLIKAVSCSSLIQKASGNLLFWSDFARFAETASGFHSNFVNVKKAFLAGVEKSSLQYDRFLHSISTDIEICPLVLDRGLLVPGFSACRLYLSGGCPTG
jgi:hypothetical protein